MSGIVTPDNRLRREKERIASIDIETVPDEEAVERFTADFEPLDWMSYLKKMKRPELDDLATDLGMAPKLYKTMGEEAKEILRLLRAGGERPDAVTLAEANHLRRQRSDFELKAALSPLTGRICTVGIVAYYGDAEDPDPAMTFAYASDDENALLLSVVEAVGDADVITGFNFIGFDGPFLRTRMLVHGMDVPVKLCKFPRYRDRPIADTMMELGDWQRQARGTLSDWCWRFGIELPPTTDPQQIMSWYQAQDWGALEEHCLRDARAAGELYQKISPVLGLPIWAG
jgi:DNA polymerase elongation subunit (family B)